LLGFLIVCLWHNIPVHSSAWAIKRILLLDSLALLAPEGYGIHLISPSILCCQQSLSLVEDVC
jgi:hypothetical protein